MRLRSWPFTMGTFSSKLLNTAAAAIKSYTMGGDGILIVIEHFKPVKKCTTYYTPGHIDVVCWRSVGFHITYTCISNFSTRDSFIQLKSKVYIHISQFKLSFSQFLTFNQSKKIPVLGQLETPLNFKNVKCQNNSRENYLFQLLFLSSHS